MSDILIEFIILFGIRFLLLFSLSVLIVFLLCEFRAPMWRCGTSENVNISWNLQDSFITIVRIWVENDKCIVRINWRPSIPSIFFYVSLFLFFLFCGVSSHTFMKRFFLSIKPHWLVRCVCDFSEPAHNLCSQNILFKLLSMNFSTYVTQTCKYTTNGVGWKTPRLPIWTPRFISFYMFLEL